ncbi:hypothetical protein Vretimale_13312 [Volvox reticuliferus]|uniref:Uncharacterized protein n=1 Tax=Volvox reticuliferus TaxID=1737510 RepID=A0A8J4CS42_9CHLO|nr:hypothetical protein Vretifemale_14063 [Volvox reticuliferus]GIM09479.1 hypothetical protein Vretimale_13312 [Volvox reticuliferus]
MDSPSLSDQQLKDLGVIFHNLPLPPIRETKIIDGRKCRVFRSEEERQKHIQNCEVEVIKNCLDGARASCVLKSVEVCRGPIWHRWLPFKPGRDPSEVEACEARVMEECVAGAHGSCESHASGLCAHSHPTHMWLD